MLEIRQFPLSVITCEKLVSSNFCLPPFQPYDLTYEYFVLVNRVIILYTVRTEV